MMILTGCDMGFLKNTGEQCIGVYISCPGGRTVNICAIV